MKTERRHELVENTLAHEMDVWSVKLRPYTNLILGGVGGLLVLYAGVSMWSSSRAVAEQAAWSKYQTALLDGDLELKELQRTMESDEAAGTTMQPWAYVTWADRQLFLASEGYFRDRESTTKRLTAIAEIYQEYAAHAADPVLRNRSQLGLARTYEMQGKIEDARREYGLVEGAFKELATRRVKALDEKSAADDIKWLATATLPKPKPPGGPGTPGERPGFETAEPAAESDAALPKDLEKSLEQLLGTGDESENKDRYDKKDAGSPEEKPAETEKPAAAGQPAEGDKPADSATAPAAK